MKTNPKTVAAHNASAPARRKGRPDRDLMRQIDHVRQLIAALPPLDAAIAAPCRRLYAPDELRHQIDWASRLSGDGGRMVRGRLQRAQELGEMRLVAQLKRLLQKLAVKTPTKAVFGEHELAPLLRTLIPNSAPDQQDGSAARTVRSGQGRA